MPCAITSHRRCAPAPLALVATLACCAGAASAGSPDAVAHWLHPASGDWYDDDNWSTGYAPYFRKAVIDAVGAAYTVTDHGGFIPGLLLTELHLDSPDATLEARRINYLTHFPSEGLHSLAVDRGTLRLIAGTDAGVRMRSPSTTMTVGEEGRLEISSGGGFHAARIVGSLHNAGTIRLEPRTTLLVFGEGMHQGNPAPVPTGSLFHNTGVIELTGRSTLLYETLRNDGVLRFEGENTSSGGDRGRLSGVWSGSSNPEIPDSLLFGTFENHGLFEVIDARIDVATLGTHSGEVRIAAGANATFWNRQTFLNGSFAHIDGYADFTGPVEGALTLTGDGSARIRSDVAGSIHTSLPYLFFEGGTIAGDLTTTGLVRTSGVVTVTGDAALLGRPGPNDGNEWGDFAIGGDAVLVDGFGGIIRSARNVHVQGDTSGNITAASLIVDGNTLTGFRANLGGDLRVGGSVNGSSITAHSAFVGGDLTTSTLNISNVLEVGGQLSIRGGAIGAVNVQANSFRSTAGDLTFTRAMTITADTSTIVTDRLMFQDTLRFTGDFRFEMFGPNYFLGGIFFDIARYSHTTYNERLLVDGSALIDARIRLNDIYGAAFQLGDSLELIYAAGGLSGTMTFASLPDLPDGLFFEIVQDEHSLRLVVVPAPSGAALAGLAMLAALRRRRG